MSDVNAEVFSPQRLQTDVWDRTSRIELMNLCMCFLVLFIAIMMFPVLLYLVNIHNRCFYDARLQ